MERRFCKMSVQKRADGDKTSLVGHAAVFYDGTPATEYVLWPGVVERIMPGAFDRAVKEDDVRALFNHETSLVLGRNGAGTLSLSIDSKGLGYRISPLGDTTVARDVAEHVDRGDVTGSSFGFVPEKVTWIEQTAEDGSTSEIRQIESVRLFDVSPVTYPAYEETDVSVRAASDTSDVRMEHEAWKMSQVVGNRGKRQRQMRMTQVEYDRWPMYTHI